MRRTLIIASTLLLLTITAFAQNQPKKPSVNDLAWFAGCWSQDRPLGRVTYEQWTSPGGVMLGMARTVHDGKIVAYEFLRLIEKKGDVYYVANPSDQKETAFKLTSLEEGVAVFENPKHDFPQTITYTRRADGINVRVEGMSNGHLRGIDLNYSPGDCYRTVSPGSCRLTAAGTGTDPVPAAFLCGIFSPPMIFEMHIPGPPLSDFVENFFFFDDFITSHLIERFLPDGNTEIIISLRDEPEHVYHNDSLKEIQTCRHGWASGLRTAPISIPSGSGSSKLVIVFRKGMAHPFFPIPMSELSNNVIDADRLWGSEFGFLRERILEAAGPRRKFAEVEEFLLRRLNSDTELNPCVEYAVGGIGRDPSGTNLARLSDKIGYSKKHLITLFKKNVGTTPKAYLRVMRFQKAITRIESAAEHDWTAIALDSGFYDQAHFINDFKALSGFTPSEYVSKKVDTLNYVPVL